MATASSDGDRADLVEIGDLAGHAHQILFAEAFDVARAHVVIVTGERLHHIVQGEVVGVQTVRIRRDVKLFHIATNRVDLGDSLEIAQLRTHDPILDFTQVSWCVVRAVGFGGARFWFDSEHVDFTEARGDRAHRGFEPGREL